MDLLRGPGCYGGLAPCCLNPYSTTEINVRIEPPEEWGENESHLIPLNCKESVPHHDGAETHGVS